MNFHFHGGYRIMNNTAEMLGRLISTEALGTIGKSARYEALDPVHLHFELHKDGNLCNPADYITFQ
jgi:hypothetical protein